MVKQRPRRADILCMTPPLELVRDLRLERRALRAERERIAWWRRLVRARMDLAVAGAVTPGPLGEDVAFLLPLDLCLQVPLPDELRTALPTTTGAEVGLLPALRALDARLAAYEAGVLAALEGATSRLAERVACAPRDVAGARAPTADRT